MSGKFIVLVLMLLSPVMIWAEGQVDFDFSSSSQDDAVPATIEKDGICLKFSASKPGVSPPKYTSKNKFKCLKLDEGGVLTIESDNRRITSVRFVIADRKDDLKLCQNETGMISKRSSFPNDRHLVGRTWSGETFSVSFTPRATGGLHIKSMKVSFESLRPKDVVVTVSSAERATLYYGDRSFRVPEGVVARTYKIAGNLLSQSRMYAAGAVLPKGTSVVLEAGGGRYLFEETAEKGVPDPYNALRGSDEPGMTSGGEVYYMFAKGSNGVGFYWKAPEGKPFTTEAHKAYLVYSPSTASQAKSFLGFEVSSGIRSAGNNDVSAPDAPACNLAGQHVGRDYKGIIIVKGKKYLNRQDFLQSHIVP